MIAKIRHMLERSGVIGLIRIETGKLPLSCSDIPGAGMSMIHTTYPNVIDNLASGFENDARITTYLRRYASLKFPVTT